MLETKDLCKTYKPKKGVPVLAVDHVSLRFPEKGMVFLLGKSGSGKSTMLNLLGGLDQYDGGEIIIKGISSKDFNQQRFDSYRNTYVGFIFQEYNVLEEFTVGANIALALELQGRTATDEELNKILHDVDLDGYGSRKPNELSGGQKQRVAIARALVKNPEIIMADEPTGALDSNTGRQVLDTLKKLSETKLVIIVSHDREYAEQYADRIIELADGKVIRDVEAVHTEESEEEKQLVFRATTIEIPSEYHLTEEDRIRINEYLDKLKSGASITLPSNVQRFKETDTARIPVQDGSKFSLIKSKLPMRSAFKIGCSSLKHKRFRLVMTILLSVIAFTLFALVDTFSSYDHIRACTDSLIDSEVNYVSLNKAVKFGSGLDTWWTSWGLTISEEELQQASEETGVPMTGVFIPKGANFSFTSQFDPEYEFSKGDYTTNLSHFCGFAEITEQSLEDTGFELIAGKMPDGSKNEIAISSALCNTFIKAGYHEPFADELWSDDDVYAAYTTGTSADDTKVKYEKINAPIDMVGKVIRLMDTDYTVTGVVDTHFDLSRYDRLLEESDRLSTAEELVNYMLYQEYSVTVNYSLTGCAMVGEGKVAEMVKNDPKIYRSMYRDINLYFDSTEELWGNVWTEYYTTLSRIPESEIVWTDGKKDKLEDNEIIISLNNMNFDSWQGGGNDISDMIYALVSGETELTPESAKALISEINKHGSWEMNYSDWSSNDYQYEEIPDAKIVGFIKPDSDYNEAMVISDQYAEEIIDALDGVYDSIVGPMPTSRSDIEKLARYCYRDGDDVTMRYEMNHAVIYELDTVNTAVKVLAKVFLYIGIFFAIFAALLMANFITTSIHYKRQEIGILRAIGSRSNDVFRIFFSESFVIAMINFAIAAILCGAGIAVINYVLRNYLGILITVLHFGIRQIVLLFVISVGIAAIASFLPVRKIAAKKPIDAIRDR